MDSMLNIKSDLDPFELYGMKNLNEDVEDIQSARIKLAVLKVQYIYIKTVSVLLFFSFGTFDSCLAGLGRK